MKFLLGLITGFIFMFIFYPFVVSTLASREDILNYAKTKTLSAVKDAVKKEVEKEIKTNMIGKDDAKVLMVEGIKYILVNDKLLKVE